MNGVCLQRLIVCLCWVWLVGPGCSDTRGVLLRAGDVGGDVVASGDAETDVALDTGVDVDQDTARADVATDADVGTQEAYCQGAGPPVLVNGGCWSDGVVFERALCACGDVSMTGALRTRMVNEDAPAPDTRASVGAASRFEVSGVVAIGGELVLSTPDGLASAQEVVVEGSARLGGPLQVNSDVTVEQDAAVNGGVQVQGDLTVGGTLTQPDGATRVVGGAEQVASVRSAAVTVAAPCGCGAPAVDVVAEVARAREVNDNAAIGLEQGALNGVGRDTVLRLPCGRYLLNGVAGGSFLIRLQVAGRVALYVDGDVALERDLVIELAPGVAEAELDLFVAGQLISEGTLRFGERARPEALRVFLAANEPMEVGGVLDLAGHVYAPESDVVLRDDAEVFGSLQTRRLELLGGLTMFFDPEAQALVCSP